MGGVWIFFGTPQFAVAPLSQISTNLGKHTTAHFLNPHFDVFSECCHIVKPKPDDINFCRNKIITKFLDLENSGTRPLQGISRKHVTMPLHFGYKLFIHCVLFSLLVKSFLDGAADLESSTLFIG